MPALQIGNVLFSELLILASEVLGGHETAIAWFHAPALGLSGARPIDLLNSEQGGERVRELLRRIEYGGYC